MNAAIAAHQSEIAKLCREFHVQRLELFGSALSESFDSGRSDVDFLVEFAPLPSGEYASAFFGFKAAWKSFWGSR
jgi:uncharacterized protein